MSAEIQDSVTARSPTLAQTSQHFCSHLRPRNRARSTIPQQCEAAIDFATPSNVGVRVGGPVHRREDLGGKLRSIGGYEVGGVVEEPAGFGVHGESVARPLRRPGRTASAYRALYTTAPAALTVRDAGRR